MWVYPREYGAALFTRGKLAEYGRKVYPREYGAADLNNKPLGMPGDGTGQCQRWLTFGEVYPREYGAAQLISPGSSIDLPVYPREYGAASGYVP